MSGAGPGPTLVDDRAPAEPDDATVLVTAPAGEAVEEPDARWRGWCGTMVSVLRNTALGLVAFLVVGNLLILSLSAWQKRSIPDSAVSIADVKNFHVIDAKLWRGAAPTDASYRDLAAQGATTVVDLRAEEDLDHDRRLLDSLGLDLVHIPIRDGQVPTDAEVSQFLDALEVSEGPVFVHCGAGVGRTGTMVAAYLVASGQADGMQAVRHNLAVGPPSLEQIAFAASLDGRVHRPHLAVVALSRVLDGPRRVWHNIT